MAVGEASIQSGVLMRLPEQTQAVVTSHKQERADFLFIELPFYK